MSQRTKEEELDAIGKLLDAQMAGLPLHDPTLGAGGRANDGEVITIVGVADNSASGAVVVDGGTTVIGGLEAWPAGFYGKRVKVSGTMSKVELAPDPVVGPNGEQSHGAWGSSSMLVNAKWEVAK